MKGFLSGEAGDTSSGVAVGAVLVLVVVVLVLVLSGGLPGQQPGPGVDVNVRT